MNRALFGMTLATLKFNLTALFGAFYGTAMSNSVNLRVTDGRH